MVHGPIWSRGDHGPVGTMDHGTMDHGPWDHAVFRSFLWSAAMTENFLS